MRLALGYLRHAAAIKESVRQSFVKGFDREKEACAEKKLWQRCWEMWE